MLLLYSETITAFIKKLTQDFRLILQNDFHLKVLKNRFTYKNYNYPINLVVFEHPNTLGYFDPHDYRIGINKKLIYQAKNDVIKNILRHEMLHFLCWIEDNDHLMGHQYTFKAMALKYNFSENVYKASSNIHYENEEIQSDSSSEQIINKVKKLLQLANSSNKHESELATMKANQLLLAYNLKHLELDSLEDEVCAKRILHAKKSSAKFRAISKILKTFFVYPVFNSPTGSFYLEVIGTKTNVELADYVGNFLSNELERLYKMAKKTTPSIRKSAYMVGIAQGYCSKIQATQKQETDQASLVKIETNLSTQVQMVYKRLSSSRSSSYLICETSHNLGKMDGQNLSIRPSLNNTHSQPYALSYFEQ